MVAIFAEEDRVGERHRGHHEEQVRDDRPAPRGPGQGQEGDERRRDREPPEGRGLVTGREPEEAEREGGEQGEERPLRPPRAALQPPEGRDRREGREREQRAVGPAEQAPARVLALLGEAPGVGLAEVAHGKGGVVEGERQLLRHERDPAAGRPTDVLERDAGPAAILLHLAGDDRAAVARADGLEAARGPRQGADGEVPAAVGADESAAVHHAAVARGPGGDRGERGEGGERGEAERARGLAPRLGEQKDPRGAEQGLGPDERAEAERQAGEQRALRILHATVAHGEEGRGERGKRGRGLGHKQRGVDDELGREGDQEAREPGAPGREGEAREAVDQDGGERPERGVHHGAHVRPGAEDAVGEGEQAAVPHGEVAPGVPAERAADHDVVGVAEACGDAASAEVVVVAIPDGLSGPGEGDVEPRQEGHEEEQGREGELAPRPRSGVHSSGRPSAAKPSRRRLR